MSAVIVTVGPAISDVAVLSELISMGVRSFRLPGSKLSAEEISNYSLLVGQIANDLDVEAETLIDLPGPKVRLSNSDPINVSVDDILCVATTPSHPMRLALQSSPEVVLRTPEVGETILVGDGALAFEVIELHSEVLTIRALNPGVLWSRTGLSWPSQYLESRFTLRDADLLRRLLPAKLSGVMVSFVESAESLDEAEAIIDQGENRLKLIAKLETSRAVENLPSIVQKADACLIGRGDLLLDSGPIKYSGVASAMVSYLVKSEITFAVGTQLLTSLDNSWLPHRSELEYLGGLIESGVKGFMLSDETTVGRNPVRAVALLTEMIKNYGDACFHPLLRPTS